MLFCKEYLKKVDIDYVVFCKKFFRNYIIRMLWCRWYIYIWNVGCYWFFNLILFIFYIVLEYFVVCFCNICKYLNKCLILKLCDICLLIYNLYVSSFKYMILCEERCDLLMWIISYYWYC